MSTDVTRVAVNGYGVIGKRVAAAVTAQDDMEVSGVADIATDWRARMVTSKGYPLYAPTGEQADAMRGAGLLISGSLVRAQVRPPFFKDLAAIRDIVSSDTCLA